MKDEYDFSGAERGKFFRKNAARAKAKDLEVNELVNEFPKRDIELIETAKQADRRPS